MGRLFLSLFVPRFFFFWYCGKALLRDCGISWVSSLILFYIKQIFKVISHYKSQYVS